MSFRIKFSPRKLKTAWRILSGCLKTSISGKASTSQYYGDELSERTR